MADQPQPYDADDDERESNIFTVDGKLIENSTPEDLERERRRKTEDNRK